ncbi:hypothetical protein O6H91_06G117700 [Diphasiastrum complanatum]|uniref:Uncharacterized protein n=1 Tax=Diphasiastrum complanatum TaxID=34168 RepID=A0ACC2DIU9_DIPCM|nr:hypothetical protein O6H91_06G117700 [Diphasiastrum complanatum]
MQFKIPKVGDKDMDLHLLYSEVTAHGGLEQVVKFQKWKNILALNLPAVISSPSFFLRKHYSKLLHHYEQVYFFRIQGELVSPPDPLPSPSLIFPLLDNASRGFQAVKSLEPVKKRRRRRRRKLDPIEIVGVDPAESIGQTVTGAIEGKFEHGYLVTVVVGSEKLRGVLYHVPPNTAPQFASLPDFMSQIGSPLKAPDLPFGGILRKKRKPRLISKKDPNAPRLNRSGYNFFFAEQRSRLKNYRPEKHTDVTKIIGELWHGLTVEERMPYLQRGKKDKERYQKEKGLYLDKIQPQLRHEYVGKAFSLLLKDSMNDEPEELEQDVEQESGYGTASGHDYHVSLDTDAETGAYVLPQEETLQNQMFGDYVLEEQIEYNQEHEHPMLEQAKGDKEERDYASDDVQDDEGNYIVQTGASQKLSRYIHGQIDHSEE